MKNHYFLPGKFSKLRCYEVFPIFIHFSDDIVLFVMINKPGRIFGVLIVHTGRMVRRKSFDRFHSAKKERLHIFLAAPLFDLVVNLALYNPAPRPANSSPSTKIFSQHFVDLRFLLELSARSISPKPIRPHIAKYHLMPSGPSNEKVALFFAAIPQHMLNPALKLNILFQKLAPIFKNLLTDDCDR